MWGLVTIFQGLLELLCPSYTVFANMLIPCALDEKRQYLRFRNYFQAFWNFCSRKSSETVWRFGKKMQTVVYMLFMYIFHMFYHKWKCLLMNIRMQSVFGVFSFYFP